MIQRVQTVFISVAIVLQCLIFIVPNWEGYFTGKLIASKNGIRMYASHGRFLMKGKEEVGEWGYYSPNKINIAILVFNTFIIFTAILTLFLFRKRKLQIQLSKILMILTVGLIILQFVNSQNGSAVLKYGEHSSILLVGFYLPFASLILFFLASRAIKADEKLVRSADKLR